MDLNCYFKVSYTGNFEYYDICSVIYHTLCIFNHILILSMVKGNSP